MSRPPDTATLPPIADTPLAAAVAVLGLRQDLGLVAAMELLEVFFNDVPLRLSELSGAVDRRDARTAERVAHLLKGSGRIVGAERFSLLCERAERAAQVKDLIAVGALLDQLEQVFLLTRPAVTQALRG
jgi:HPt (histidine-containing phosphotransfer) domain-containing protein